MTDPTRTFRLTIELTEHEASLMPSNGCAYFAHDQPARFWVGDDGDVTDPKWVNGQMAFFDNAAELVLWRAYEQAAGFDTMFLSDLGAEDSSLVVASTRAWRHTC